MKKFRYPLLVLLLTAVLLTSCKGAEPTPGVTTDTTWDRIQKNGKVVVGVSIDYPPYEYMDTNFQADGFDIAMISALSQQMGLPFDVRNYSFNGLYNALQTGQIDIAVSAITVTPDRQQVLLFSNVYLTDSASALAPPGSPITISSPSQLAAYRVGVQQGTVFDSYMTKNFVQNGLMPSTQLYRFIKPDDAVANLVANKIDIVLMDTPSAQVYQEKNNLKMAGTGINPQPYAIAMPLNSPVLQANLNSALKTLNNNGTLGKLAKQYLNVDPSTVLPPSCINDMAFVSDVTYPDNNMKSPPEVTPGQVFVKTWRVKNTGTCTWVPGYQLAYAYGNTPAAQMGGQPVPITSPINAGATVDLSVTLTAPKTPGTYQGFWQMNDANKQAFGQTIWVGVTVVDNTQPTPAPIPAPVVSSFTVSPGSIQQGQCVNASWSVSGKVDKVVFERNGQDLLPNAPVSGTYTDCPPGTGQVQYGLGAYGPGGKDIKNVYINVSAAPAPTAIPTIPPAPTATVPPAPKPPIMSYPYNLILLWGNPPVSGTTVTLQLESSGTASGNDGCLQYTAQYTMSANKFSFTNVAEVAGVTNCLPDAASQASNYLDTLNRVKSYLIDGSGNLVYYDSNGAEILRYK
jgi:ABC-type amino acid transport substrate-binding protein/heat shock protein HslJ